MRIAETNRTLYETARAKVTKKPDGSVLEEDVLLQLKLLITIDEDAEKERKAKRIIDALCKSNSEENHGQLHFADEGTWEWEPLRLIRSDDGDLIENSNAVLRFKRADAQRSGKHAEETQMSYRRKQHEADIFTDWVIRRVEAGIPKEQSTWGGCVEDLGILDPLGEPGEDDAEE